MSDLGKGTSGDETCRLCLEFSRNVHSPLVALGERGSVTLRADIQRESSRKKASAHILEPTEERVSLHCQNSWL